MPVPNTRYKSGFSKLHLSLIALIGVIESRRLAPGVGQVWTARAKRSFSRMQFQNDPERTQIDNQVVVHLQSFNNRY